MLDPSIEELREYVNNHKLNNKHETNARNETAQHLSNEELIKLLETDTPLNMDESPNKAQHLTEKTLRIEDENCSNVLKVVVNDVEGLTLEIRESFYSKLCNALSSNYKTTFSKQDSIFLTESNICDIAKKIEYGILSTAKDLNSYKLAGADAVVNIEKETCYRNLYKSLFNEIELLRLRNKMQTAAAENPYKQPSVLTTESESSSCKESEFQDAQSEMEPMVVDTVNNNCVKLLDSQNATLSESEYLSCSSIDESLVESQQNCAACSITSNTQEPKEKHLEVEKAENKKFLSISTNNSISVCNNNNYIKKIPADCNILKEEQGSNVDEISQKISCSSTAGHSPIESQQNSVSLCNNNNYLGEIPTESSNIWNEMNNGIAEKEFEIKEKFDSHMKDCSQVRLHTNVEKIDVTVTNEALPLHPHKLDSECIETEPTSVPSNDLFCNQYDKKLISLENDSTKEMLHEERSKLSNNSKIFSSPRKNISQNRTNKLGTLSPNVMCKIANELDLSQFSISIENEELIDEIYFNSIAVKEERSSPVFELFNYEIECNKMLQDSEHNLKKGAATSLATVTPSKNDTEFTATEGNSVADVTASTDSHESNIVKKNNCLKDEKEFDRGRVRLDKILKVKLRRLSAHEISQKISCSRSVDHSPIESQQNRVSVCNNNNYLGEIPTESTNIWNETNNGIAEKEFDSKSKRRKRKVQCDIKMCGRLKVIRNKKQKLLESETSSKTSAATTTGVHNEIKEKFDSYIKDCSQVRLDTNVEKIGVTVTNEALPLHPRKLDSECTETEPTSLPSNDLLCNQYDKKLISLKNDSTKETVHEERCKLSNNSKITSSPRKNISQNRTNKLGTFSPNVKCKITKELDLSQFSISIENEELIDEIYFNSIAVKEERSSPVFELFNYELEYSKMLQDSEHNLKSGAATSFATSTPCENNTEVTATEKSSIADVAASTNSRKSNIVKENNCLIDEEAFDRERARLDKLREELKKRKKERKIDGEVYIIHSDYEQIFGIIMPIIRKYYPSEYIPDEGCYGHVLQRLQIDLTYADMCDDDKALYVKESITTMRYLCENCIVQ